MLKRFKRHKNKNSKVKIFVRKYADDEYIEKRRLFVLTKFRHLEKKFRT